MAIGSAGGAQAATGWQRPIQLATPVSLDVFGVQAAFSEQGAAAVGYGVMNVDSPASSDAFLVARSATGKRSGPKRISEAKEILALGWRGSHETLLTGTSESSQTCCSSAQTRLANGSGKHTIVSELAGATQGRLVSFAGRLLAVVGTERGVWVAQSDGKGHFGGTRKLSGSAVTVDAVDAVAAPHNDTVTAWAGTGTGATPTTTNAIVVGRGSAKAAPRSGRRLISLRSGHSIDELALAPAPARSGGATAVWVESWSDAAGNFHSVVMAADLTRSPRRHQLSSSSELAAGLNLAGDANGDQAAAWKSCDTNDACAVRATLRAARGRFSSVQRGSAIDASESPTVAVSPTGESLLGWVQNGHVRAAAASPRAARFGAPHTVSATNYATELQIAFGPARTALATWTQGTLGQSVMSAAYLGR